MKRLALVLAPALLSAADPAGVVYWTPKELSAYAEKLKPKMNEWKVASQTLNEFGNHLTMVAHREGDGEAEIHDSMADFFVVQSGEATLVTGGKMVDGKNTAPGEHRAPKIDGGSRRKLATGDIVHIPSKVPHQLLIEKGKQFTYFVVKVKE